MNCAKLMLNSPAPDPSGYDTLDGDELICRRCGVRPCQCAGAGRAA